MRPTCRRPTSREAFLADPVIADSVALWDRIDAAVVGVGLPHRTNSPDASAATPSEQALTAAAGDVIRHYFDADGKLIDWEGEGRMIAVSVEQLRRIPLIIGVASGEEKAAAIIGAARAGLISALVTDARTAEAVVDRVARSLMDESFRATILIFSYTKLLTDLAGEAW